MDLPGFGCLRTHAFGRTDGTLRKEREKLRHSPPRARRVGRSFGRVALTQLDRSLVRMPAAADAAFSRKFCAKLRVRPKRKTSKECKLIIKPWAHLNLFFWGGAFQNEEIDTDVKYIELIF